jgi:type IV secretory pathway VirJ component
VLLPKVGHGFGVESRWMPQLQEAFTRLTRAPGATKVATAPGVRDLPLIELRSGNGSRELAVVISGDGGWAGIDRQIGETFAAEGVTRLPDDLRGRVQVVALLGPSHQASFEFHFADLLGGGKTRGQPTLPEIRGLRGLRLLCVYGTDETDSACRDLPPDLASVAAMPGGHHFGGAYREVARWILHVAQAY